MLKLPDTTLQEVQDTNHRVLYLMEGRYYQPRALFLSTPITSRYRVDDGNQIGYIKWRGLLCGQMVEARCSCDHKGWTTTVVLSKYIPLELFQEVMVPAV